uniref:Uncharacterized protein n=1 Tax=Oryza sativa subsp. japonica TaxID=39947 RepID=Q5Z668_ORYSJ|nr:hypothetical protein [Oryza sativa Japonica Group]
MLYSAARAAPAADAGNALPLYDGTGNDGTLAHVCTVCLAGGGSRQAASWPLSGGRGRRGEAGKEEAGLAANDEAAAAATQEQATAPRSEFGTKTCNCWGRPEAFDGEGLGRRPRQWCDVEELRVSSGVGGRRVGSEGGGGWWWGFIGSGRLGQREGRRSLLLVARTVVAWAVVWSREPSSWGLAAMRRGCF